MKHDLADVDLNLLVYLELLLEEASVARAARRADLSPSAMSRALQRLRNATGDPLLVPSGRGVVCTAHATDLLPRLRELLAAVRTDVLTPPEFAPATATGEVRVAAADSTHELLGRVLVERLLASAPGVRLRLVGPEILFRGGLGQGLVDLGLGPMPREAPHLLGRGLFRQSMACLVAEDHPALQDGVLDLAAFVSARHGLVAPRGRPGSIVDDALAELGLARMVHVTVSSFSLAPALADAGLIVTLPVALARRFATRGGVRVVDAPLALPTLSTAMVWHARRDQDPAHRWLRDQVVAVCESLGLVGT